MDSVVEDGIGQDPSTSVTLRHDWSRAALQTVPLRECRSLNSDMRGMRIAVRILGEFREGKGGKNATATGPSEDYHCVYFGRISDCAHGGNCARDSGAVAKRDWKSGSGIADDCWWQHYNFYRALRKDTRGCV